METPDFPPMSKTVPDIDWLMKMVDYLFQRDFDEHSFNQFIKFSKGLNDAKRRLFFGMMGLVVYLKRKVEELGGTAPGIRPFTLYNWILDEFGSDPVGNAKRELAQLPDDAGKDLEDADYNHIARVVREVLGLNKKLDEGSVRQMEGSAEAASDAEELPPPSTMPDEVPARFIDRMVYDINPKQRLRIYVPDDEVRKWFIYELNQCETCELAIKFVLASRVEKGIVKRDTAHDRRFLEALGAHLTHTKGHGVENLLDLVQRWIP